MNIFVTTIVCANILGALNEDVNCQLSFRQTNEDEALKAYIDKPNEENFMKLCAAAKHAKKNEKLQVIYHYSIVSEFMRPIDPAITEKEVEISRDALRKSSKKLGEYLGIVIQKHQNPWRRWTAAKVVGKYGGKECLESLQKYQKAEKNEVVRKYLDEAIKKLNSKKSNDLH